MQAGISAYWGGKEIEPTYLSCKNYQVYLHIKISKQLSVPFVNIYIYIYIHKIKMRRIPIIPIALLNGWISSIYKALLFSVFTKVFHQHPKKHIQPFRRNYFKILEGDLIFIKLSWNLCHFFTLCYFYCPPNSLVLPSPRLSFRPVANGD